MPPVSQGSGRVAVEWTRQSDTPLDQWPGPRLSMPLPPPDAQVPSDAYHHALDYLYGLSAVPRAPAAVRADRERKLARMQRLLTLWGDPQGAYAAVLIAGTKGKGSTAAMLAAILRAAGYRVGRYTQPHLVSYCERVWVDGQCIGASAVVDYTREVRSLVQAAQSHWPELGAYTTFEVGTALALTAFARARVEVAVVEVGVGGAHDATAVLEPVASAIAPISADHLATLGPTLEDVAREKAGVLRRGRPVVISPQAPHVERVLRRAADRLGAHAVWLGRDWRWTPDAEPAARGAFSVAGVGGSYPGLDVGLLGRHQRDNATLAVATAHALAASGFHAEAGAVHRGLASVDWPGRVQLVPTEPQVLVDGAHNVASVASLAATLEECFPGRPRVLVLGCTAEKDLVGVTGGLARLVDRVMVTRSRHPRAASPDVLRASALRACPRVSVASGVGPALHEARRYCPPEGLLVVAGSLFVAGEALECLAKSWQRTEC